MTELNAINQSFREYATRVTFNLSLSRNQIFVLWCCANSNIKLSLRHKEFGLQHDIFVPGAKWLISHGFITYVHTEGWSMFPYQLTEVGKHAYALLELAGVLPQYQIAEEAA
jgi:hypothetical protein